MISTTQTHQIGDTIELMRDLPEASIDLCIADPPYYRIDSSQWDRQWKTLDEYLNWIETVATEIKRVLKPNGSLFVFGDDHRIAYVQVRLDKHFSFLNHLIWHKRNNHSIKGAMNHRRYACVSERILFYEQKSATGLPATGLQEIHSTPDCFKPIKDYMRGDYQKVMDANGFKTKAECDAYLNEITDTKSVVTHHYFADSQYCFPTFELYGKLRKTGFFVRNYEDLRRNYEDLRYNFNYQDRSYDVWHFNFYKERRHGHPTQKPFDLIKRIVLTSSNAGDLVCDPAMGTGTTMKVCEVHDRNFVGAEIAEGYEAAIRARGMTQTPPLTSYCGDD